MAKIKYMKETVYFQNRAGAGETVGVGGGTAVSGVTGSVVTQPLMK